MQFGVVAVICVLAAGCASCTAVPVGLPKHDAPPASHPDDSETGNLCGKHRMAGVELHTYCGKGSATAIAGKKTVTFTGAQCDNDARGFTMAAGTLVTNHDVDQMSKSTHIAVRVPANRPLRDGTYSNVGVDLNDTGMPMASDSTKTILQLTKQGTAGIVEGPMQTRGRMRIQFNCNN